MVGSGMCQGGKRFGMKNTDNKHENEVAVCVCYLHIYIYVYQHQRCNFGVNGSMLG